MPKTLAENIKAACDRWTESPAESVSALTALLKANAGNIENTFAVLEELIPRKEWQARIAQGQMPYHVAHLDELFFHHAKPEFLQYLQLTERTMASSVTVQTILRRCMALFVAQDFAQIDKLLAHVTQVIGRNIWNTFAWRPAFFEMLAAKSDAEIGAGLPQVTYVREAAGDGPIIYLSCDIAYCTKFAVPLARSIAAFPTATPVHLHVMNATVADVQAILDGLRPTGSCLSASCEALPPADAEDMTTRRAYFHAVRMVRFYQLLKRRPREGWMLDVDGLFNRPPQDLFACRGTADVAFRARPGRFEPWNQFNASVVGIAPTPPALNYLCLLAGYVAHFHRKNALAWGIDQLAMYGAFRDLQKRDAAPSVALLDDKAVDYETRSDGIVWCNSGTAKHTQAGPANPVTTRYAAAFAKHGDSGSAWGE